MTRNWTITVLTVALLLLLYVLYLVLTIGGNGDAMSGNPVEWIGSAAVVVFVVMFEVVSYFEPAINRTLTNILLFLLLLAVRRIVKAWTA